MGSLVSLRLRYWPGLLLSVTRLGLDNLLPTRVAHMAFGLNLKDSVRQHQMGAVDSSDPEDVRRAGGFREGFSLKVALAWSLHPSHGMTSPREKITQVKREIRMEGKAE